MPHSTNPAGGSASALSLRWYRLLLSVRPAQAAAFLKRILRIRRGVTTLPDGSRFAIDPVSIFGLALLSAGCHEPELTLVVKRLLRSGDTFVDVGGNEGYFSVLAGRIVQAGAVFCIEPQRRLLPVIERNLSLNALQSVSVHNLAFSDREGTGELFLRPSTNTGASSFIRHWKLGGVSQSVETVTLDAFATKNAIAKIRLMKIDCEGAEGLVIKGAMDSLRQHLFDFLTVDFHTQICGVEACDRVDSQIREAGYQVAKHGGITLYFLPERREALTGWGGWRTVNSWKD